MKILRLNDEYIKQYESYILKDEKTLFYISNKYRLFLKEYLKSKDCYFILIDEFNNISGILPAFLKENTRNGNVLNSLPYYGSNGGIIDNDKNTNNQKLLLESFNNYASLNNCISSTIITSPFCDNYELYDNNYSYTYKDFRIGQLTHLLEKDDNLEEKLILEFNSVRRRNIRKAIKSNITVDSAFSDKVLKFLIKTHTENITAIQGIPKSPLFFKLITDYFTYNEDYKIFTAYHNGNPVASLLLFYFNKTVEYFTPVIVEEYRTYQPLSILIFRAMIDAINSGFKWWNWGGTWKTQTGVYNFKKKWNSQDHNYYYYTKIYSDSIYNFNQSTLLSEYPHFYVLPFDKLRK